MEDDKTSCVLRDGIDIPKIVIVNGLSWHYAHIIALIIINSRYHWKIYFVKKYFVKKYFNMNLGQEEIERRFLNVSYERIIQIIQKLNFS